MQNRKITQWLNRIEQQERKDFVEYLRSPLHSNRPKLSHMIEILEENFFQAKTKNLSCENYWDLVYPDKGYNGNLLSRLLSEITGELKPFFSMQRYRNDPAARCVNLVKEYRARGWDDLLPKAVLEANQILETEIPKDEHYYYYKQQLAWEKAMWDTDHLEKAPKEIFQESLDQLDRFNYLCKVKYFIIAENFDRIHGTEHEHRFSHSQDKVEWGSEILNTEVLQLFYYINLITKKPDLHKLFFKFKDLLIQTCSLNQEMFPVLSKDLGDFLFVSGINYTYLKINNQETGWVNDFIELYKTGLKNGYLLEKGIIPDRTFILVTTTMSKFGLHEENHNFISNFSSLLKNGTNNIAVLYSHGFDSYSKGDFLNAKNLLVQVKNGINSKTDISINLNSRVLLCRSWLDLDDWYSCIYEASSFKTYLNRNKLISKDRLKPFHLFSMALIKLERISLGNRTDKIKSLEKLKTQLLSVSRLSSKNWILDKIQNEIKKAIEP